MIAIPILLFLLLAFGFWVLVDSKVHLGVRIACVVGLFFFGLLFWKSTSSFLGWPADGTALYNIPVTVHSVLVDEPTDTSKGGIFVTVRQPSSLEYKSLILRSFGYPIKSEDPRLYRFDYRRDMHEAMQQQVVSRLMQGQKGVRGTFTDPNGEKGKGGKGKGNGKGDGKGKGGKGKGKGSQSQESKPKFFHKLQPRYEYDKNAPVAPTLPQYKI